MHPSRLFILVLMLLSNACGGTQRPSEPVNFWGEPNQVSSGASVDEPSAVASKPSDDRLAVSADTLFAPSKSGGECPDLGLSAKVVRFACDCQKGAAKGCIAGDDAADGTEQAPVRTFARALELFLELDAGQTLAFCRGGAFAIEGHRDFSNARCRANQPCVVRDYQPTWSRAKLPAPKLTASEGDGFRLANGGDAQHQEGLIFLNLDLRSTSAGQAGTGFFFYNDIDDVLVCGTTIDGFRIGVHAAGSNPPGPGSDGKNVRLVVRNSRFTNIGDLGWLGGCDGCGVEYSSFENNGFNQPILTHSIYFASTGATGMFARHNDLYRTANIDGRCQAAPFVAHGRLKQLLIEGNTVREERGRAAASCWGIAVDSGYADRPEAFENVVIRGNEVRNVGGLAIGINACKGCVIENNVIVQEQAIESTLISAPNRGRSADDQPMGAVIVRNNTLFAKSSAEITGIALGGEAEGHVAVSNAMLSLGSGQFVCFAYDLPHAKYAARDNNVCHVTAGAWTRTHPELAAWQREAGVDRASKSQNPGFTLLGSQYDFTPKNGSPLLDAGHNMSAPQDRAGRARGSRPDIGAVQRTPEPLTRQSGTTP